MKNIFIIGLLSIMSALSVYAQAIPDISGDWNGPNDLILHLTYFPSTKKVNVDYCGIYRSMEWSPSAKIENGYLILTQAKDSEGSSFSGKLRINSKDKLTGNLSMISYGDTDFSGNATFTRSDIAYFDGIKEMPGNNTNIDTSLKSGGQSSDYQLCYPPLSNETVVPTAQVPESVWKKNWTFVYGKDKFGDENRADPRLVASGEFVTFIITPRSGIYLVFPDAEFAIIKYDNSDISIKTKNGAIKEMSLNQVSRTVFQLTNREDNFTMLDILDEGYFKLVLELSEYGIESKKFNARVTNQTLGVINAMEYYYMDIPGFQEAWDFYGD